MIRKATIQDASQICDIYNYYVLNSIITFEEQIVELKDMEEYIRTGAEKLPWLVYEENQLVVGYAYASSWKSRCAYKFSLESTIYLKPGSSGRGIGTKLYTELLTQISALGYRAVIGGISLPNPASIALHEKLGFEKIGHFKEVGYKFDKWIDVGYWQLLINKL